MQDLLQKILLQRSKKSPTCPTYWSSIPRSLRLEERAGARQGIPTFGCTLKRRDSKKNSVLSKVKTDNYPCTRKSRQKSRGSMAFGTGFRSAATLKEKSRTQDRGVSLSKSDCIRAIRLIVHKRC
jgi:hypothetical protein